MTDYQQQDQATSSEETVNSDETIEPLTSVKRSKSNFYFWKNRNFRIVFMRLCFLFIAATIIGLVLWLCLSGYWVSWQLKKALQNGDIAYVQQHIPTQLLTDFQPKIEDLDQFTMNWQGAGKDYLKQAKKNLYQNIDTQMLFLTQVQFLFKTNEHDVPSSGHYSSFPNLFILDLGSEEMPNIQIKLEQSLYLKWQVVQVSLVNTSY